MKPGRPNLLLYLALIALTAEVVFLVVQNRRLQARIVALTTLPETLKKGQKVPFVDLVSLSGTKEKLSYGFLLIILLYPVVLFAQDSSDSAHPEGYLEEIFAKVSYPHAATLAFYQELEQLASPSSENDERLARLYSDILDIMNYKELERWKDLQAPSEKVSFLKRSWIGKDPTPATVANERLIEHYARLLYARSKYAWRDVRGYDDRGEIYVRFGPPDDYVEDVINAGSVPVSSWVYRRYGPNLVRGRIDRFMHEYVSELSTQQGELPNECSEVFAGMRDLPCALHLAQFQSADHNLDLVATYGFRTEDLHGETDAIRVQVVTTVRDTTLAICASQDTTYEFTTATATQPVEFSTAATYALPVSKYYFLLGITNASARQRGMRDFSFILGTYPDGALHLSSAIFSRNIIPAHEAPSSPHFLRRHNLAIMPYAFAAIKRRTPMFVYFEIYDPQRDENGETFYEVEYEVKATGKKGFASLLASLNPFEKSGGRIALSDTRRGKAAVEPTYLQFDFSHLHGGRYDLVVRVTDKLANITKQTNLKFELE